jgi:hypothetical protein
LEGQKILSTLTSGTKRGHKDCQGNEIVLYIVLEVLLLCNPLLCRRGLQSGNRTSNTIWLFQYNMAIIYRLYVGLCPTTIWHHVNSSSERSFASVYIWFVHITGSVRSMQYVYIPVWNIPRK